MRFIKGLFTFAVPGGAAAQGKIMTILSKIGRRGFLAGSAGAAGVIATGGALPAFAQETEKGLPEFAAWKDAQALIVHSDTTLETQRNFIGTKLFTPSDELFIRNNLPTPDPQLLDDRDSWTIDIKGVVNASTLSVGQLKAIGIETVTSVLQCSGNGRAFFEHKTSGTQWSVGAAGNVVWTGVPLRDVVAAMGGLVDGANWITGTGGEDIPEGVPAELIQVERSVPVAALEQALLAWEMNGKPVPLAHGGPLRLVIPGYYGVNNVKYIKKLTFSTEESNSKIQQSSYRIRPVGEKSSPSQPSMFEMNVKSWITSPLENTAAGKVHVYGVALGGTTAVEKVEVSTDGGTSWNNAEFIGPDMGPYSWRPFMLTAELAAGTHVLASRASAADGSIQPEDFPPNERGYGHNGWRAHAVEVSIT